MEVNAVLLKEHRINKGWTQQQVAELCGLSLRTIQRVERYGQASNETVSSLAAVFEIPRTEIMHIEDIQVDIIIEQQQPKNSARAFQRTVYYLFGMLSGVLMSYLFVILKYQTG